MTDYTLYKRDPVTGHLIRVAILDCVDDRDAALQSRSYADGGGLMLRYGDRLLHCRASDVHLLKRDQLMKHGAGRIV